MSKVITRIKILFSAPALGLYTQPMHLIRNYYYISIRPTQWLFLLLKLI